MTGLECLREEMEKRGCGKSMIESKSTAVVLDILSNMWTINTDTVEAEKRLRDIQSQIKNEQDYMERLKAQRAILEKEIRILEREDYTLRDKDFAAKKDYIDKFSQMLQECETPEARDAMKRAQLFVNTVNVNTKYDNTAFIAGLAAILTDGKIGALDELKKINPKLDSYINRL